MDGLIMKTLEQGKNKVQKICDALRLETLEPAKNEAANLIKDAEHKAEGIISQAKMQAHQMIEEAKREIEQERNVFHSSLESAARQSVETLRQSIENDLFSNQLDQILHQELVKPDVVARLINAIIVAIERDGISVDISAMIPKTVKPDDINALIIKEVKDKLHRESVEIGDFDGGAQVKIKDKKMMVDITGDTLKELISRYVRKDFRKTFFGK